MIKITVSSILLLLIWASSCVPVPNKGKEGEPCFSNGTCVPPLVCENKVCVSNPSDGGTDAGMDGGEDAGTDGGTADGGCLKVGGDCSPVGAICCTDLYCNADDKKCVTCIQVGSDCTGLSDVACCQGADPLKGAWCEPNTEGSAYFCKQCSKATSVCATNLDCCPPITKEDKSLICGSDLLCKVACHSDLDCTSPEICMPNGDCQRLSCSCNEDCGGKWCCSGVCKSDNTNCYGTANKCRITSVGGILFKDNEVELNAVGYESTTNTIIPAAPITWTVADTVQAGCVLNPDGGINRIKDGDGDAGICTVTAMTGSTPCTNNNGLPDAGILVFNSVKATTSDVTVYVYDQDTGLPIAGAEVWTSTGIITCAEAGGVTDANGKCTAIGTTDNIHVKANMDCSGTTPCYEAVSVVGITKNTYVIHLPQAKLNPDISQTLLGGIRGITTDSNGVDLKSDPHNAMWMSYTATSIAGNIQDMPFRVINGELFNTKLVISTPISYALVLPFSGGIRAAAPLLQINEIDKNQLVKDNYVAPAIPGLRTAWAFGGGLNSRQVTELVPVIMTIVSECTDISTCPFGKILVLTLPIINNMGQSIVSAVDIPARATIPTKCIDNITAYASCSLKTPTADGGYTYCPGTVSSPSCNPPMVDNLYMSDYINLTNLVMKITAKMTLRTKWTIPELPTIPNPNVAWTNICMDGANIIAATNIPGVGVVPLGVTAGVVQPDSQKAEANCKIHWATDANPDQLTEGQEMLRFVPLQHGLEGNKYTYVVMSANFNSLFAGSPLMTVIVIKDETSVGMAKDISDKTFLRLAVGAALNRGNGVIAGTVTPAVAVTGASFYRYRINDDYDTGTPPVSKKVYSQWTIYVPTGVTTTISLPSWDLAKDPKALMSAHVYKSNVSLADLVSDASGKHLNSLFDVTEAFSHATCAQICTQIDPKYCVKGTAINPACRLQ